jgi:hypothetical protein
MSIQLPEPLEAKARQFENVCRMVDTSLECIAEIILRADCFPVMVHAGPAFNLLVERQIIEALWRQVYKCRRSSRSPTIIYYIMPKDDPWPTCGNIPGTEIHGQYGWEEGE